LKSTTQRTDLPSWDLMMKNVYSIGAYQVNRDDFRLDIYYDDPGAGLKRFLPETNLVNIPLLRIFNLDNLNVQGDPVPDGVFDFVENVTINTRNGRIMFPVLEPFGSSLVDQIDGAADKERFSFQMLYDSTIVRAREFPEFNRFTIKGSYKSAISNEISLGSFNLPPNSVTVTSGAIVLKEGTHYEIDYNIGRIKILDDAILASGNPIKVNFEDNTLFGFQTKTLVGVRADYEVNDNLSVGGTFLNLFERPFTQKVNIGDSFD
jgi:cell surface protein SprA